MQITNFCTLMSVEMAELVMVEYLQIGYFFWRELVTLML
jgi:hypothetical protein